MENEKKSQVNITNNFNAPIGQHIDHVDNIFFSMERDGTFHFAHVDNIHTDEHPAASPAADNHGGNALYLYEPRQLLSDPGRQYRRMQAEGPRPASLRCTHGY